MTAELRDAINAEMREARESGDQNRINIAQEHYNRAMCDCQYKTAQRVKEIKADVDEMKSDIKEIKAAVTAHHADDEEKKKWSSTCRTIVEWGAKALILGAAVAMGITAYVNFIH